jgi:cyclophilin family peptidyl-prolyl cis-trans isomerase
MVPARLPGTRVGSVDSAPVSKAAKRERQRLNREARKEIEDRIQKRRRTMRTARVFAIAAVPVIILGVVLSLTNSSSSSSSSSARTFKSPPLTINATHSYTATIDTTKGLIVVALDVASAPKSVNNFVFLARKHFYDGLLFTRAVKSFVIQTGSPSNNQLGGPGYTVAGEVPKSAYQVGSVAWAKSSSEPNGAAGSQFFIGTGPQMATLPLQYGIIGTVTQGLAVGQQIEALAPASGDGPPTSKVRITKVTIAETATPPTS